MNVRMFGNRCLVEHYRPKSSKSQIIIPDAAQQQDTHRFGKVVAVGDGKLKDGKIVAPLVKIGDTVMFQINQIMEATQKYMIDGKSYMNLLQSELIGKLTSEDITMDNFEVLGDYLMLKHFFRQPEGSQIIVPDNIIKQSAPSFIYFKVLKKGINVDTPVEVGDEVICNLGRLTPLFFVQRHGDGTSSNEEYCYTHKDWVDGRIEPEGAVSSN
jgi:co-chaperonin GroES (HSP10)